MLCPVCCVLSCPGTSSDVSLLPSTLHLPPLQGFLILHGTDTMAYTASALSFLLEDLGKSVVITGSQVPFTELRNDAYEVREERREEKQMTEERGEGRRGEGSARMSEADTLGVVSSATSYSSL